MREAEEQETNVGLDEKGKRGYGHQQGGGKRGWRRLKPKALSRQMQEDEEHLRKRCLKD